MAGTKPTRKKKSPKFGYRGAAALAESYASLFIDMQRHFRIAKLREAATDEK